MRSKQDFMRFLAMDISSVLCSLKYFKNDGQSNKKWQGVLGMGDGS